MFWLVSSEPSANLDTECFLTFFVKPFYAMYLYNVRTLLLDFFTTYCGQCWEGVVLRPLLRPVLRPL
jgi:hypothetical protein